MLANLIPDTDVLVADKGGYYRFDVCDLGLSCGKPSMQ